MRIRSWLSTCSSAAPHPPGALSPPPKSLTSETSSTSTSTDFQSNSSLQSNLSLLTLPSVPSLQNLPLSPLNTAETPFATALPLTSLNPNSHATINSLALHNNLLYAAAGDQIHVFDIINDTLADTFNGHKTHRGSLKSVAFLDGKIITAHQDCKIRVWKLNDQKQHKPIATLPTLQDRLTRFILPQNYVDVRRHKKKLWIHHHDVVSGLTACQNEKTVISVSWDRSIKIWKARDNYQCHESINKAHDDAINAVVLSRDGLIYTGSADRKIKVWKRVDKKYGLATTLEKHKSAVNALALDGNGSVLFSGSCDRSILVWEREDSANHMGVVGALRGHARAILCLINVQDLLFSGSADRTVRIWQRGFDGRYCCLTVLDGHQTPVRSLAAERTAEGGGVKVFSGSFDGEIRVWQVEVSTVKGYYN